MIQAITPTSVLGEWETYAALRLQQKPVEMIYFPDGQHILQKPLERLASQQSSVDWFRFWVQGYERKQPITDAQETVQQLTAQYVSWHKLRELQRADLSSLNADAAPPN